MMTSEKRTSLLHRGVILYRTDSRSRIILNFYRKVFYENGEK
jgi:hypothetical protein